MKKSVGLATILLAPLLACTVKQGGVANSPPAIGAQAMKFGVQSGTLKDMSLSIILYPNGLSEAEYREKAKSMRRLSKKITEELGAANIKLDLEIRQKFVEFQSVQNCAVKYGKVTDEVPDLEDISESDKIEFNELTPVAAGEPGYDAYKQQVAELQACQENQSVRRSMHDQIDSNAKEQGKAMQELDEVAGPGNSLSSTGALTIDSNADGRLTVSIALSDFIVAGLKQTTAVDQADAGKNPTKIHDVVIEGEHLKFSIPDTSSKLIQDSETSSHYEVQYVIDAYRAANLVDQTIHKAVTNSSGVVIKNIDTDFARYAGDAIVYRNGERMKVGSVQILGRLEKTTVIRPALN